MLYKSKIKIIRTIIGFIILIVNITSCIQATGPGAAPRTDAQNSEDIAYLIQRIEEIGEQLYNLQDSINANFTQVNLNIENIKIKTNDDLLKQLFLTLGYKVSADGKTVEPQPDCANYKLTSGQGSDKNPPKNLCELIKAYSSAPPVVQVGVVDELVRALTNSNHILYQSILSIVRTGVSSETIRQNVQVLKAQIISQIKFLQAQINNIKNTSKSNKKEIIALLKGIDNYNGNNFEKATNDIALFWTKFTSVSDVLLQSDYNEIINQFPFLQETQITPNSTSISKAITDTVKIRLLLKDAYNRVKLRLNASVRNSVELLLPLINTTLSNAPIQNQAFYYNIYFVGKTPPSSCLDSQDDVVGSAKEIKSIEYNNSNENKQWVLQCKIKDIFSSNQDKKIITDLVSDLNQIIPDLINEKENDIYSINYNAFKFSMIDISSSILAQLTHLKLQGYDLDVAITSIKEFNVEFNLDIKVIIKNIFQFIGIDFDFFGSGCQNQEGKSIVASINEYQIAQSFTDNEFKKVQTPKSCDFVVDFKSKIISFLQSLGIGGGSNLNSSALAELNQKIDTLSVSVNAYTQSTSLKLDNLQTSVSQISEKIDLLKINLQSLEASYSKICGTSLIKKDVLNSTGTDTTGCTNLQKIYSILADLNTKTTNIDYSAITSSLSIDIKAFLEITTGQQDENYLEIKKILGSLSNVTQNLANSIELFNRSINEIKNLCSTASGPAICETLKDISTNLGKTDLSLKGLAEQYNDIKSSINSINQKLSKLDSIPNDIQLIKNILEQNKTLSLIDLISQYQKAAAWTILEYTQWFRQVSSVLTKQYTATNTVEYNYLLMLLGFKNIDNLETQGFLYPTSGFNFVFNQTCTISVIYNGSGPLPKINVQNYEQSQTVAKNNKNQNNTFKSYAAEKTKSDLQYSCSTTEVQNLVLSINQLIAFIKMNNDYDTNLKSLQYADVSEAVKQISELARNWKPNTSTSLLPNDVGPLLTKIETLFAQIKKGQIEINSDALKTSLSQLVKDLANVKTNIQTQIEDPKTPDSDVVELYNKLNSTTEIAPCSNDENYKLTILGLNKGADFTRIPYQAIDDTQNALLPLSGVIVTQKPDAIMSSSYAYTAMNNSWLLNSIDDSVEYLVNTEKYFPRLGRNYIFNKAYDVKTTINNLCKSTSTESPIFSCNSKTPRQVLMQGIAVSSGFKTVNEKNAYFQNEDVEPSKKIDTTKMCSFVSGAKYYKIKVIGYKNALYLSGLPNIKISPNLSAPSDIKNDKTPYQIEFSIPTVWHGANGVSLDAAIGKPYLSLYSSKDNNLTLNFKLPVNNNLRDGSENFAVQNGTTGGPHLDLGFNTIYGPDNKELTGEKQSSLNCPYLGQNAPPFLHAVNKPEDSSNDATYFKISTSNTQTQSTCLDKSFYVNCVGYDNVFSRNLNPSCPVAPVEKSKGYIYKSTIFGNYYLIGSSSVDTTLRWPNYLSVYFLNNGKPHNGYYEIQVNDPSFTNVLESNSKPILNQERTNIQLIDAKFIPFLKQPD